MLASFHHLLEEILMIDICSCKCSTKPQPGTTPVKCKHLWNRSHSFLSGTDVFQYFKYFLHHAWRTEHNRGNCRDITDSIRVMEGSVTDVSNHFISLQSQWAAYRFPANLSRLTSSSEVNEASRSVWLGFKLVSSFLWANPKVMAVIYIQYVKRLGYLEIMLKHCIKWIPSWRFLPPGGLFEIKTEVCRCKWYDAFILKNQINAGKSIFWCTVLL